MRDTIASDDKVRLFQLYLLSFMRVSPIALASGLQQLNSTHTELETVKNDMQGRGYQMIGGPDADFYYDLLGEPISNEPIDNSNLSSGFYDSREFRFKLPLWADFDFVVKVLPDNG